MYVATVSSRLLWRTDIKKYHAVSHQQCDGSDADHGIAIVLHSPHHISGDLGCSTDVDDLTSNYSCT